MNNIKIERWINETGKAKNGASTILLKGLFLGTCAKMRNGEGVSFIYKLPATRDNRANMKLTSRNEQWTFQ